ncbi:MULTISPECIES: hypothetical protein [unclassified Corallococcus]|uniref:hypothetical protein n=1 Tax=unclassified Corallococcus TaxID=2685029 RepID=UPI001A8CCF36|nr:MULTISPECIES: hypothetical protein [unclassified Corallococcus]MBN9687094.1 hypothetical protein [Corallococcus sp. NCSPR001]WAS89078.1 hypothetical protein O0N60_19350 [Corallococcus sp. NCRR]
MSAPRSLKAARHRLRPRSLVRGDAPCCVHAEQVVCSCRNAWACEHHGETHPPHHED